MDIRNIKAEVPKTYRDSILNQMYQLNDTQFRGYQAIENLPHYPMDINSPKNQIILKDFIGRVIEELTEGFESLEEAIKIIQPHGWNIDCLTDEEYSQLLNHIANANEEQADALGFFFTLLMYSNIMPEDLLSFGESLDKGLYNIAKVEDLYTLMAIGVSMMISYYPDLEHIKKFNLIDSSGFDSEKTYEKFISYAPGFHSMNNTSQEAQKLYLWQIIYKLNIARNLLKSRPWKQTQVMTKEIDFQKALVEAFYLYMGYLGLNGFTPDNLFVLFFKKQVLNLWRQGTQY